MLCIAEERIGLDIDHAPSQQRGISVSSIYLRAYGNQLRNLDAAL